MLSSPSTSRHFFVSLRHFFLTITFVIVSLYFWLPCSSKHQKGVSDTHNNAESFFFAVQAFSHAATPSSSSPQFSSSASSTRNPFHGQDSNTAQKINGHEKEASSTASSSSSSLSSAENIRPIYQNWWPVSLISSLDPSRPNAIELLEKRLVLWKSSQDDDDDDDDGSGGWTCLDDACAHRFAPLSEGRIVQHDHEKKEEETKSDETKVTKTLQCAYHGWEFTNNGSCSRIPQATANSTFLNSPSCQVRSYPVKIGGGMVWVWSDPTPSTFALAQSIQLPISPLLDRYVKAFGTSAGFQRDLPYGAELLGENLLDLSHLPFSHHNPSPGSALRREQGGPVPLRMLSVKEKKEKLDYEIDYWNKVKEARKKKTAPEKKKGEVDMSNDDDEKENSVPIRTPLFQAEVINASKHDPIFVGLAATVKEDIPENAECTISFYDPCHVRYRRIRGDGVESHVELFICPMSGGKSRVFLFNVFGQFLPPTEFDTNIHDKEDEKKKQKKKKKKPSLKQRVIQSLIKRRLSNPVVGHMIAHNIFDGDGIFLHKQGDRMVRRSLHYKDYYTPTSSDMLVNAYRRFLDAAAKKAIQMGGLEGMSAAYAVASGSDNGGRNEVNGVDHGNDDASKVRATTQKTLYLDNEARSTMLDRYSSHTKHCKTCSLALEKCQRKENRMSMAFTALVGACGASGVMAALGLVMGIGEGGATAAVASIPARIVSGSALAFIGSFVGAIGAARARKKAKKMARQFQFVDYVHADMD